MKWKIYSVPEFTKLIFSRTINGDDNKYRMMETNMYTFVDFIQRQLNKIRKFENEKEYTIEISDKEDVTSIFAFAQFCVRAVQNPLGGQCAYIDDSVVAKASVLGVTKTIKNEVFMFTNKTGDPEIDRDNIHALAIVINSVHAKTTDGSASVTIECVSYN